VALAADEVMVVAFAAEAVTEFAGAVRYGIYNTVAREERKSAIDGC
jgi:hypothetical protein